MIARDEDGKFQAYTMPGCYPVYHVCDDGGILCPSCANDPRNPVHIDKPNDGWRIIGSDVNYEDPDLFCDHCNQGIESAYAED